MRCIEVEKMAKYYYALQLIALHDFSYINVCDEIGGITRAPLCFMYKSVFLKMDNMYPMMICQLKKKMQSHKNHPRSGPYPPIDLATRTSDETWYELEKQVSKWPYYNDKPKAIERWKKARAWAEND